MKIASRVPSRDDWQHIDAAHFARLFGTAPAQLPPDCLQLIQQGDFAYRTLAQEERDRIVIEVCKKIDSPTLTLAGQGGKERWEKGWNENLQDFIASGCDLKALVPKFVRPDQPIRFEHDYVMPRAAQFELEYYRVFRRWLFRSFLAESKLIYEFGCGTGYNLAELAELYPQTELHGLDWVSAPKEIIRLHGRAPRLPDDRARLRHAEPGSRAADAGRRHRPGHRGPRAIGTQWEPFLDFILERKPALFVHVDSILEWYERVPADRLPGGQVRPPAQVPGGLLAAPAAAGGAGAHRDPATQRSPFGSLFHDGYSLIVWRPKG